MYVCLPLASYPGTEQSNAGVVAFSWCSVMDAKSNSVSALAMKLPPSTALTSWVAAAITRSGRNAYKNKTITTKLLEMSEWVAKSCFLCTLRITNKKTAAIFRILLPSFSFIFYSYFISLSEKIWGNVLSFRLCKMFFYSIQITYFISLYRFDCSLPKSTYLRSTACNLSQT